MGTENSIKPKYNTKHLKEHEMKTLIVTKRNTFWIDYFALKYYMGWKIKHWDKKLQKEYLQ